MEDKNFNIENWILGFTDGEGCFYVSFTKRSKMAFGIEVRLSFSLSRKPSSLFALELFKTYFKCGGIRYSKKDNMYKYEVRDIKDLTTKIIPFFEKHLLITNKKDDFIIFADINKKLLSGSHLNFSGLENIIELAYQMNDYGKRKYLKLELLKFVNKLKV